jgi:hypothetical protein
MWLPKLESRRGPVYRAIADALDEDVQNGALRAGMRLPPHRDLADHLGVTPDEVTVLHGDTRSGPEGFGTFGSRSVALGGGALVRGSVEVRDKGRRIAARMMEAAPEDVVGVPGGFQVAGVPDRRVSWKEVATAAYAGGQALPSGDTPGLGTTRAMPSSAAGSSAPSRTSASAARSSTSLPSSMDARRSTARTRAPRDARNRAVATPVRASPITRTGRSRVSSGMAVGVLTGASTC